MHIKRRWAALCAALFLLGAVPMTVGAASSYLEAGDKTYFKTRQAQRGLFEIDWNCLEGRAARQMPEG